MDEETSQPVCNPIDAYQDVFTWEGGNDPFSVAKIPRAAIKDKNGQPKTLICHDMKGGYLDDRFVQGSSDSEAYRFYHWEYIDIFIYFSHHLVTIPPPCWTNAGHRHGVKVLGTLITEWKFGFECCDVFLENSEVYERFASKLVNIAEYYGFDGWLVNIENIVEPWKVNDLQGFLRCLTRKMHECIPSSIVLWYDSVTNTGHLDWQDELNEKNSMYFDVCDGIFLNYNWNDTKLQNSKKWALASDRPYDVYAGIDVFGRGTPGGGGYNTREALDSVRRLELSAAIFAQGWVYETHGKENFTANENRFWRDLYEFCPSNIKTRLPLVTSFCQGYGQKYYLSGVETGTSPWSNLSLQQIQPHLPLTLAHMTPDSGEMSTLIDTSIVYQGGTSLLIEGELTPNILPVSIRLFNTDIPLSSGLKITLVLKEETLGDRLTFLLDLKQNDVCKKIYLTSSLSSSFNSPSSSPNTTEIVVQPSLIADKNGWSSRMYRVSESMIDNYNLIGVTMVLSYLPSVPRRVSFYLGQLKVVPIDHEIEICEVQDIRCTTIDSSDDRHLNNRRIYKLEWRGSQHHLIDYYNIYSSSPDNTDDELCGQTCVEKFQLVTMVTDGRKKVIIQPVYYTGEALNLHSCAFYRID